MASATVLSINISSGGIPKRPIEVATITTAGILGDGHHHAKHNSPLQALSILDVEDLEDLRSEGFDVYPGATGENITVRGLSVDALNIGDRLKFSGGVEAEVTKIRKPCYVLDAIDPQLKSGIFGRCGVLAKVVRVGELRPGESIEIVRMTPAACANV